MQCLGRCQAASQPFRMYALKTYRPGNLCIAKPCMSCWRSGHAGSSTAAIPMSSLAARAAPHPWHSSSSTTTSRSSFRHPSLWESEQVTRTVLGCSAGLAHLGLPPAGLGAFCTAAFTPDTSSSSTGGSSSSTASLATSLRVQLGPVSGLSAELLSDALLGLGAQSVVVEEGRSEGQQEQERFGAEAELWDSCKLLVHFAVEHDVDASMQMVQDICDLPDLPYTVQPVVDEEWVAQIQASYVPVQVADGLFIVPDWCEPTEPSAINVRLTPGVAFGTGEHPTTKLCLQQLRQLDVKGANVMDYGTGSGVLALAALLLGAASAVGTDTDPLAVRAAAANAALNGLQDAMQLVQCGASLSDPDPLPQLPNAADRKFDLVMANILRGPLLELQPRLTGYCKAGGRLLMSGILSEQVSDVQAAYAPCFEDFQVECEGSWAVITAVKK